MPPPNDTRTRGNATSASATLHPAPSCVKQLPLPPPFAASFPGGVECDSAAKALTIYTIGHSNHEAATFIALLRQHEIDMVVDVRSAPYSRYIPHFNRETLDRLLGDAGIRYVWEGEALGGRPDDPACYRDGVVRPGNVDYQAMAQRPPYQRGIDQLLERAACGPFALMCSEEDPRRCHRHRLLEPSLRERGVAVRHIRKDGSLESIDPAAEAAGDTTITSPQLTLPEFAA
jgi:hypothetical protein